MLTKIYFATWALFIVAVGAFAIAGTLNLVGLVAAGFFAFGMIFMGMMAVLPTAVHETLIKH